MINMAYLTETDIKNIEEEIESFSKLPKCITDETIKIKRINIRGREVELQFTCQADPEEFF